MKVTRENLLRAIQKARMAVTKKNTVPIIALLHMSASDGTLSVTGTNLDYAIIFQVPCDGDLPPIVVPPAQIAAVIKSLPKKTEVMLAADGHKLKVSAPSFNATVLGMNSENYPELPIIGDNGGLNHDFASNGEMTVVWRKFNGKFPNIEQVIKPSPITCVSGAAALKQALSSVLPFTDRRSRSAKLTFAQGMLEITSSSIDNGECAYRVPVEFSGDLVTALNVGFVMDLVNAAGQDAVTIGLADANTAVNFSAPGFMGVVMPMRF